MPLVTTTEMFKKAYEGGYAIGAFNVNNMEIVQGITRAAKKLNAPVILQCSAGARKYASHDYLVAMVKAAAEETGLPIALHLDHGPDFETCKACIDGGFTSVMIDGSSLPFEENVELTREVVKYAHARGVSVEGELGVLAGVEDHVFAASSTYTNPLSAIEFFQKTGVDALAISYGTMHGASKGRDVKLRKEIPTAIRECMRHAGIRGALVSHGSSTVPRYIVDEINALGGDIQNAYGISKEELRAAIPCGISKINVDTDIRLAVTRDLRELFRDHVALRTDPVVGPVWALLDQNRAAFDPRVFLPPLMDTVMYGVEDTPAVKLVTACIEKGVREAVGTLVVEFGSVGRAPLVEQVSLDEMAQRYARGM